MKKIIPFDLVGAVSFSPFYFGCEVIVAGPDSVLVKIYKAQLLAVGSFSDLLRDFLPLVRRSAFARLGLCLCLQELPAAVLSRSRLHLLRLGFSVPAGSPHRFFWSFLPPLVRSGLSSFAAAGQKFMFLFSFSFSDSLVQARCLYSSCCAPVPAAGLCS
jgi:hypothetical protein